MGRQIRAQNDELVSIISRCVIYCDRLTKCFQVLSVLSGSFLVCRSGFGPMPVAWPGGNRRLRQAPMNLGIVQQEWVGGINYCIGLMSSCGCSLLFAFCISQSFELCHLYFAISIFKLVEWRSLVLNSPFGVCVVRLSVCRRLHSAAFVWPPSILDMPQNASESCPFSPGPSSLRRVCPC
jgi:hypothetical protein